MSGSSFDVWECPECYVELASGRELEQHQALPHYRCPECEGGFASEEDPPECPTCGKQPKAERTKE